MKKFSLMAVTLGALMAAASAQAAIITNGGFETGSFAGWTQSGNTRSTSVSSNYEHTGTYGAKLGPVTTAGSLSQTFSTEVGGLYALSYWLEVTNIGGFKPNSFSTKVGDNVLFSGTDISTQLYKQYTYDFVAAAAQTTLTFSFRHDPAYFGLDDVSVIAKSNVPEPTTGALLGLGLLGFAASRRKAAKK